MHRHDAKRATGKGWQGRLSSRTGLVGCKESRKYSRILGTASCTYSTESHRSRTARARTKVHPALLGCECSQNRKSNGTAQSYRRRTEARGLWARLEIGRAAACSAEILA